MTKPSHTVARVFEIFISEKTKKKGERLIVTIAIFSFLIHVIVIVLNDLNVLGLNSESGLLTNPIAAIYTPFSFILIYEVYLLVYYLPKSTSNYIGKQYEIITLIVIRRIFKDLSNLDLSINWFSEKADLQFTYDLITTLLLFILIYFFHHLNKKEPKEEELSKEVIRFIFRKKIMAIILVPVFLGMAFYSLGFWLYDNIIGWNSGESISIDLNNIFFGEFFTILILTDVLLLLLSLYHTDKFSSVIRNSGFIISTILIRISFGIDGLLNNALIVVAVLFGVLILLIHNQYRKIDTLKG